MSFYSVMTKDVTVSAAQDLIEILAPATATIELISYAVTQNSDYGDAQAEGLTLQIVRGEGTVTSGSGGSTPTPRPLMKGFAASEATVEMNNTTKMVVGTGALMNMHAQAFNVQIGAFYQPTPEERIFVSPGDRVTVELVGAPADALTLTTVVNYREIGAA